jgi:uncharacterized glyoxalase superfamily protein PhnB
MRKAVKPVPDGCHTVNPYLIVPLATEAMAFYEKAFGAEEVMRMPGPDGKSTLHAELRIGDSTIMISDENPQYGLKSPKTLGGYTMSLHLYVDNVDALFRQAVGAGCTVMFPVADMFWGDRFGKVMDPFGHVWGIATHKEDLSEQEMQRRADEWMQSKGK